MIRLLPERGGWLEVVCGPMFSGKSEELIRRLRRAEIAGQRALIVKPRIDDRYDIGHVVSHAGAKMRAVAVGRPEEIDGLADGYDAVGIDEVQFFAPTIVDVIERLIARGTRVVVAGPSLTLSPITTSAGPVVVGDDLRDLGAAVAVRVVRALGGSVELDGDKLTIKLPE